MSPNRLDNLIPLRSRLNEWQLAGWTPAAVAEQGLGCRLMADVMIPMADGTLLSADIYTPKAPGRYPVIVQFSAYNRDLHSIGVPAGTNEIGSPPVITGRGYVQVVVTARGIGRSGAKLLPWLSDIETADYLRCIAWAAEQPWSNGDVCLFGTSYYGMIQPLAAAQRPPALRAFFCNEICTDFHRHIFHYGGLFNVHFFSLWCGANFTTAAMRRHVPPVVRAALSHLVNRPWLWRRVRHHVDRLFAKFKTAKIDPDALRYYAAAVANREDELDPPLGEGSYRHLSKIEVPFVVVQNRGLIGLHQFGAYDLFEHAGTAKDRKWLIVGPAEYELPVYSWQMEALAFFDHVVKGVDNGYDRQAPVRYWGDGAGEWRSADDFPPRDARTLRLYPTHEAGGALTTSAPTEHKACWLSVPRGVPVLPGVDAIRPQVLCFSWTAPQATELAGPVMMKMTYATRSIPM